MDLNLICFTDNYNVYTVQVDLKKYRSQNQKAFTINCTTEKIQPKLMDLSTGKDENQPRIWNMFIEKEGKVMLVVETYDKLLDFNTLEITSWDSTSFKHHFEQYDSVFPRENKMDAFQLEIEQVQVNQRGSAQDVVAMALLRRTVPGFLMKVGRVEQRVEIYWEGAKQVTSAVPENECIP